MTTQLRTQMGTVPHDMPAFKSSSEMEKEVAILKEKNAQYWKEWDKQDALLHKQFPDLKPGLQQETATSPKVAPPTAVCKKTLPSIQELTQQLKQLPPVKDLTQELNRQAEEIFRKKPYPKEQVSKPTPMAQKLGLKPIQEVTSYLNWRAKEAFEQEGQVNF